jgi:serine/threonine-protein kinase HipA
MEIEVRFHDYKKQILFEYSPEFIKTGLALSPFHLPNKSGVFIEKERIFSGLYGLFNDSLPDGWGLLLMDRAFRQLGIRTITALERFSYMSTRTMGALTYHPAQFQCDILSEFKLHLLAEKSLQVINSCRSSYSSL